MVAAKGDVDGFWLVRNSKPLRAKGVELSASADISYQIFDKRDIFQQNAHRSIFKGTIFRDSQVKESDFSRADFEGTRFEDVIFINVKFDDADLRSCFFSGCRFVGCSFLGAHIHENILMLCNYESSSFESSSITRSRFTGCTFKGTKFSKSVSYLNVYSNCTFNKTGYLHCTLSLCVFNCCKYNLFSIKAESLCYLYGISWENLANINVYFQYNKIELPYKSLLLKQFTAELLGRRWYYPAILIKFAYDEAPLFSRICDLVDGVVFLSSHGVLINSDELSFFQLIIEVLAENDSLPLYSLYYVITSLNTVEFDTPKPADEMCLANLRSMHAKFFLLFNSQVNNFWDDYRAMMPGFEPDRIIKVRISFKKKPRLSPENLINDIVSHVGITVAIRTGLIADNLGSWEAILVTSLASVFTLYLLLFAINGCLVQATEIKARWKTLTDRNLPAEYKKVSLSPRQILPKPYSDVVNKLLNYVGRSIEKDAETLGDYSNDNINEINVDI